MYGFKSQKISCCILFRNKSLFEIFFVNLKFKNGKSSINFENEVLIMKSVAHQNLIKLEEVFETKKVKRRVFYSSFV